MATKSDSRAKLGEVPPQGGYFAELVSPDGERKYTPKTAEEETRYRYNGYLPAEQQKAKAPEPPAEPTGPKTVGTGA